MAKNHAIVLFLDRNGFSIFQDNLANILRFNFSPDAVLNMDVIDKEQLAGLISSFIGLNKIAPSSLAMVLSDDVVYEKDLSSLLPNAPPDKEWAEIQKFLENVPFESVLAKTIKTESMSVLVAVNKDLITSIEESFSKTGSVFEAVVPAFLYGPALNFTAGLTPDNAQAVLQRGEVLRLGNLLINQQEITVPQNPSSDQKNPSTEGEKKPKNMRQYIFVGAFVLLLIILGFVYLNSRNTPSVSKKAKSNSVIPAAIPSPAAVSIVTPTPFVSSVLQALDLKNIKIKIVQNSESDPIADSLKGELSNMGFKNVTSEVSTSAATARTSILFSKNSAGCFNFGSSRPRSSNYHSSW